MSSFSECYHSEIIKKELFFCDLSPLFENNGDNVVCQEHIYLSM